MKELWSRFTAWLSGWPGGISEENKIKEEKKLKKDEELFKEEAAKTKPKIKPKRIKGLNPKKKKKTRKQGNLT